MTTTSPLSPACTPSPRRAQFCLRTSSQCLCFVSVRVRCSRGRVGAPLDARAGRSSVKPYALFTIVWRLVQIGGISLSLLSTNESVAGVVFDVSFLIIQGLGAAPSPCGPC